MNNKLFFDFISAIEKILHLIILGMVTVSYTHLTLPTRRFV